MSTARERLPLGLEPRDDVRRVHPGFDDLQRDLTMNRAGLFREPDFAHAAFSQALKQTVRADGFK